MLRLIKLSLILGLALGSSVSRAVDVTLYQRLEGTTGITRFADQVIDVVRADKRMQMSHDFSQACEHADFTKWKKGLAEWICEKSGGACHYSGPALPQIGSKLDLTATDWRYLAEDIDVVIRRLGIEGATAADLRKLLMSAKTETLAK